MSVTGSNGKHISRVLPGGVEIGVERADASSLVHSNAFIQTLSGFISKEAEYYGAPFRKDMFPKILHALEEGRVEAWFIFAKFENCTNQKFEEAMTKVVADMRQTDPTFEPPVIDKALPVLAGAAVEFPTVIMEKNGTIKAGKYGEDLFADDFVSALTRELTKSDEHKGGIGLGYYSMIARIYASGTKNIANGAAMPWGIPASGRMAEFVGKQRRVRGLYKKFEAHADITSAGEIITFPNPIPPRKNMRIPISLGRITGPIDADHNRRKNLPDVFATSWTGNGREYMTATFTRGISSFNGDPIVRVKITNHDRLPENSEDVAQIIAGLLAKGMLNISKLGWVPKNTDILPLMRIHLRDEPEIAAIIKSELGGLPRELGASGNRTHASFIDYGKIPKDTTNLLKFQLPESLPLHLVEEEPSLVSTHLMWDRKSFIKTQPFEMTTPIKEISTTPATNEPVATRPPTADGSVIAMQAGHLPRATLTG